MSLIKIVGLTYLGFACAIFGRGVGYGYGRRIVGKALVVVGLIMMAVGLVLFVDHFWR